jgi:tRNA-dihydrouridine synthase
MIITKSTPYTKSEIKKLCEVFDTYIKTVIDIEKKICSAGSDRHYESEKILLEQGSNQTDLWGGGIDIDTKEVVNEGACSGLIKNPKLAAEIIQATKEGAGDLPVSVKTRIGFENIEIETWIRFLLEQKLAALTLHLRTVRELSKVPAHWETMAEILKLRDQIAPETMIIGNGDIATMDDLHEKYKTYGCEGVMIGRGIFTNPWMFGKKIAIKEITPEQRVSYFLEHIEMFEKQWQGEKNFANLKKFAKTYINNFPEASNFREKLMETKTMKELKETLQNY